MLSDDDKKKFQKMLDDGMTLPLAKERIKELSAQIASAQCTKNKLAALEPLIEFQASCDIAMQLNHNDQPRAHNIVEAARLKKIIITDNEFKTISPDDIDLVVGKAQKFLVSTDFAALIDDDIYNDSDFMLPYQHCIFEFVINDRPMVNICFDVDGIKNCIALVKTNDYWWLVTEEGKDINYCNYMWMQIKALCIAIESGITDNEIVSAPRRINESREKKGKQKISDYHVVSLGKRFYARSASHSGDAMYRQRLHFRRGHWRHYEDTKVWIKWCLAGDPSLGFINKHYCA